MTAGRYKVRVYHQAYGCDTGCCGHVVEIDGPERSERHFDFGGYYGNEGEAGARAWAIEHASAVIAEHWPECLDSIDWESADLEEVAIDC